MPQRIEISIRQMQYEDVSVAMELKNAEGWNQLEADWRFFLSQNPEMCFVACSGAKVVGTVTAITYGKDVAWIGMMLVNRNFRRQGIGNLLMKVILEKLESCTSVKLDASPLGTPVYRKFGFVEELELWRMIAVKLITTGKPSSDSKVDRFQPGDTDAVIAFDKLAFGVSRPELIRFLVMNRSESWWVAKRANQVVGVLGSKRGSLYYHVGPIYAENQDIARDLVKAAAKELTGNSVSIDIHTQKEDFREWLTNLGFNAQRPFNRMYLEQNPFPGKIEFQFAICGPELG